MLRWYKQSTYNLDERCRFCGHRAFDHMIIKNFGQDDQAVAWDTCSKVVLDMKFQSDMCTCPGFASQDNLKYLEELSGKSKTL